MIFASVDIGSNAGRLLIANVYEKNNSILAGKISLVRVPLRLGMDVFERGYISQEKVTALIKTFKAYNLIKEIYNPIDYVACATAAMREASNKDEIIQRISEETNNELRIIDGLEEAEILSTANNIYINKKYEDTLYVDVGGGSTECSLFHNDKFIASKSFNIGTIRLLFDKVNSNEWVAMEEWFKSFFANNQKVNCICSGGNITTLVKLFGNNDNTINRTQLKTACGELEKNSYEERMQKYNLRPDRADVIIPATKIYNNLMKWSDIDLLIAPRIGLADGLVIELYKNHKQLL
jgi:exopolyphosphatase/guanosine-5'-triphosphate,3'-diphosphate pyrophosphatase